MTDLLNYQPPADLLRDRIILVTGAADGIGCATSRAAAAAGATVILLDRDASKLETLYDDIRSSGAPEPVICALNLETAGWSDYETVAEEVLSQFGRLDGLVHSAVHFETLTPISDLSPETWMRSLQINLTAVFTLTQLCLPALARADQASTIFLTDSSVRKPRPFWGAYAVTKSAVESLMQLLSEEQSDGTRFNAFDPGPVQTRLWRMAYPAANADTARPADAVAPALIYLLSDEGAEHRGEVLSLPPLEAT